MTLTRKLGIFFLLVAIGGGVVGLTGAGIATTTVAEKYNLKKVAGQMANPAYLETLDSRIKTGDQLFKYGGAIFLGGGAVSGAALFLSGKRRRNYTGR